MGCGASASAHTTASCPPGTKGGGGSSSSPESDPAVFLLEAREAEGISPNASIDAKFERRFALATEWLRAKRPARALPHFQSAAALAEQLVHMGRKSAATTAKCYSGMVKAKQSLGADLLDVVSDARRAVALYESVSCRTEDAAKAHNNLGVALSMLASSPDFESSRNDLIDESVRHLWAAHVLRQEAFSHHTNAADLDDQAHLPEVLGEAIKIQKKSLDSLILARQQRIKQRKFDSAVELCRVIADVMEVADPNAYPPRQLAVNYAAWGKCLCQLGRTEDAEVQFDRSVSVLESRCNSSGRSLEAVRAEMDMHLRDAMKGTEAGDPPAADALSSAPATGKARVRVQIDDDDDDDDDDEEDEQVEDEDEDGAAITTSLAPVPDATGFVA